MTDSTLAPSTCRALPTPRDRGPRDDTSTTSSRRACAGSVLRQPDPGDRPWGCTHSTTSSATADVRRWLAEPSADRGHLAQGRGPRSGRPVGNRPLRARPGAAQRPARAIFDAGRAAHLGAPVARPGYGRRLVVPPVRPRQSRAPRRAAGGDRRATQGHPRVPRLSRVSSRGRAAGPDVAAGSRSGVHAEYPNLPR